MACPLCGDRCTCSFAPVTASAGASAPPSLTYEYDDDYFGDDREPAPAAPVRDTIFMTEEAAVKSFAPPALDDRVDSAPIAPPEDLAFEPYSTAANEEPGPMWKQEITSRLENYRARRGSRRPRYNENLSLDFDRAINRMIGSALAAEDLAQAPLVSAEPAAEEYPEEHNEYFGSAAALVEAAEPEPTPAPVAATNLLEFPRLPTLFDMAPSGNELAEPVVDKPRILYVPEEVPTAQAPLADIQINPDEPPAIADIPLPIGVAPMGQRVFAALVDALIVAAAAVVFMAVVLREVPAPDTKLGYMLVAALPVALWAIYEYLFLVHCAGTPGMRVTHLAVRSFDREPVGRRVRRARALAWMLSAFPLGLGIVWALLDEDTLCWHDRITRTYLVAPVPEYEN